MEQEQFDDRFAALTDSLSLEKLYDQMADRADIARKVALHAAELYKLSREAGLPRHLADFMTKSYWNTEMGPVNAYVIGGEGL